MLVFPDSGPKNHRHQTHSLANDFKNPIGISPSSPVNPTFHNASKSTLTSIHEEFENKQFPLSYYPETKSQLEIGDVHVGDFSMPCSSPFQLDYEYSLEDFEEVGSNSALSLQINYDRSSFSAPSESLYGFNTNLSSKHNLHSRPIQIYPSCPCIVSNSSSMQTSEESTPLFQRPIPLAENTPTPTLASSGNSVVDLVLEANTTPAMLTNSINSEDALFNEHLELLMEYTTSPLSKCGHLSIDCWLDFPHTESKQGQNISPFHERQYVKDEDTSISNQSNRSISYQTGPNYYPHNQLGRQFTNMASCVDGGFQYIPWLRTINRNMLYNQSNQFQNRYNTHPSRNQIEVKHAQRTKRNKKDPVNLLNNNNGTSNSTEIPSKPQSSLHDVFNDDCNIRNNLNNEDDSDNAPEECDNDDDEYSDYDAADDDSDDWNLPTSRQTRKRKNRDSANSEPKRKRTKKIENKEEVDEDSDNDIDPDDSSSQLKPRRKASESARNILMNWLVENEDHPYPSKKQKLDLAATTGLSLKQIVHWMSNIRKRRMIPLLSGRRKPSSAVDVKFIDDIHRRRAVLLSKQK